MSDPIRPEARPSDVSSIDAIVKALYEAISFPPGSEPDWDRLRSLFHPGGRLVPAKEPDGELRVFDLESWIAHVRARLGEIGFLEKGLVEWEIARTQESFGAAAHAFSTYELRFPDAGPAVARGINSIQLVRDRDRWWTLTIFWDSERDENPIPERYL